MFEEQSGHTVEIVTMPASTTDQFGQYRLWLSAENPDIDVYRVDVIWAPQLANHFVDLSEAAADVVDQHFPAIIESQTVDGRLVALPMFTDAPALYYRTDLLEKHGAEPPATWVELTETAQTIMDAERAEGNDGICGFVWQGAAYEGLTCNALEWVKSNGGGQIVEPDGEISINNENAAEMIDLAATWVGTISPPGVLGYREEEARGVWQLGNAVFMRNWPYAYALEQWRQFGGQGPVRRGAAADRPVAATRTPRRWAAGTSPSRTTARTRKRRSRWPSSWPAPRSRRIGRSSPPACRPCRPSTRIQTCWRRSR